MWWEITLGLWACSRIGAAKRPGAVQAGNWQLRDDTPGVRDKARQSMVPPLPPFPSLLPIVRLGVVCQHEDAKDSTQDSCAGWLPRPTPRDGLAGQPARRLVEGVFLPGVNCPSTVVIARHRLLLPLRRIAGCATGSARPSRHPSIGAGFLASTSVCPFPSGAY
jgi:hypothetical protein